MHLELNFLQGESKESSYIILYIGIVCSTSYIKNSLFAEHIVGRFVKY